MSRWSNMQRSFDNLARSYARLEKLLFGRKLEKARDLCLKELIDPEPQKALILGEGDGRFTCKALTENPLLTVDSVEKSPRMRTIARTRVEGLGELGKRRYQQIPADALFHLFPPNEYDYVVIQFFLDCFNSSNANRIIAKIANTLKTEGKLVYLDFTVPHHRPYRWLGNGLIALLYLFFRATTDIEAEKLPRLNWPRSLALQSEQQMIGELITCQTRKKTTGTCQRTSFGNLS